MTQEQVLAIVRQLITIVGGILLTNGYITSSGVEQLVGIALGITSMVWSLWQKQQAEKTLQAALTLPVGATKADAMGKANTMAM